MFICDKNFSCCNWQYSDRLDDIDEEFRDCDKLLEVEVVRHGKWMPDCDLEYCSECKGEKLARERMNYCPYCGAKMDLE